MSGRFLKDDSLCVERRREVGCGGTWEVLHAFSGDFVGEGFRTYRNQNEHLSKTPASSEHVPTLSQPFLQSLTNGFLLK